MLHGVLWHFPVISNFQTSLPGDRENMRQHSFQEEGRKELKHGWNRKERKTGLDSLLPCFFWILRVEKCVLPLISGRIPQTYNLNLKTIFDIIHLLGEALLCIPWGRNGRTVGKAWGGIAFPKQLYMASMASGRGIPLSPFLQAQFPSSHHRPQITKYI